jgi:hypothetical protein
VNCLKTGCRSLFIAAVEYFGPGNKFEGLKELEIPYKRTKMDNSVIVYIIRLYIYLKESPEITKALLAIEATINPGWGNSNRLRSVPYPLLPGLPVRTNGI